MAAIPRVMWRLCCSVRSRCTVQSLKSLFCRSQNMRYIQWVVSTMNVLVISQAKQFSVSQPL